MSSLRALTSLALLAICVAPIAACSADASEDDGNGDEAAIINGELSGTEDDAVVALYRRGQPHCTATVVGENVLVTALHCVAELQQQGPQTHPMLGERIRPSELTVFAGAHPAQRPSATVVKVVVPDPVKMDAGPVPMSSNDVAIIYVQPTDPAFAKIRPRRLAQQPAQNNQDVTVVGYGGQNDSDRQSGRTSAQRMRRTTRVVAGASQRALVRAQLESGTDVAWRNLPLEFTTETVACGGDSGGPAFDSQGNVVGIVSAIVGECVEGSLSVFSDIASHSDFLNQAVTGSKAIGCLSDTQCGGASSGKICDTKSNKCILGCRASGNGCPSGKACSTQGQTPGTVGICRAFNSGNEPSDPAYDSGPFTLPDMPGITCPGNPLCPTTNVPQQRECRSDSECNGQNGVKPRVCDIPLGRCLDGCRMQTQGMCATGQACGAYQDDPAIGLCQVATPPPPPPGPPASPPQVQPQPVPASTTPDLTIGTGETSDPTTAPKKKKNKAKSGDNACSVGAVGSGTSAPLGLALLALASLRRRRRG
jgi:MYXO-CTERM domain-containing protein